MMSVTRNPAVAKCFVPRTGMIYEALVPESELVQQTIEGVGKANI